MVAIELAASCRPFRKSNARATAISATSRRPGPAKCMRPGLEMLDQHAADLVGDVLEAVDDLFQVVVDLGADDIGHRVGPGGPAVERLDARVVEGVGLVLQAG